MFAARANQENAVYEQQTAAAAKPLNQGVKGLAPKTPGNKAAKTPFKIPLNDENGGLGGGKTGGKGKQQGLFGDGKGGKLDASAFVTPAGPRNRAPLGNKTTNAKATAFQTPAPPTQEKLSAKPSSPRMRRAKIKIHEAEPEAAEHAEEREIEFMPSREVPMPDPPDDWPADRTYPQFEGNNLTRGWFTMYDPPIDEDEKEEFSDIEEKLKRIEELNGKKKAQQQAKKTTVVKKSSLVATGRDPLAAKSAQRLTARGAASALSKTDTMKGFAAPTAATKARAPPAVTANKTAPSLPGNTRHTVAKVASNSTLGYSKGRVVSASARKPLLGVHREEPSIVQEASPSKTSLKELFGMHNLDIADEDADLGFQTVDHGLSDDDEDGATDVFQLDTLEI